MNDVVKETLAKSKYSDGKALDLRLAIQALQIELGHRGYEYDLLNRKLRELQDEYAQVLGVKEKESKQ